MTSSPESPRSLWTHLLMDRSLTQQILILVGVTLVGVIGLVEVLDHFTHTKAAILRAQDALDTVLADRQRELKLISDSYVAQARGLAQHPAIRRGLVEQSYVPNKTVLEELLAIVPGGKGLRVLDAGSSVIAATDGEPTELRQPFPSEAQFGKPQRRGELYVAEISAPVLLQGNVAGHVILTVSVDQLAAALSDPTGLGSTGEVMLATSVGEQLEFIFPGRSERTRTALTAVELPALASAIQGTATREESAKCLGTEVVVVGSPTAIKGWGMVAKMDRSEVLRDVSESDWMAVITGGLVTVLGLGLAMLLARQIVRPITALTQAADQVAQGNLALSLPSPGLNEVGNLSGRFNEMVAMLRSRTAAAVRDSETRIRMATEVSRVGIWEWHIPSGRVRWDALMFQIYGVEPTADGVVPYETWRNAVLPEDLPEQEAILQRTAQGGGSSAREFRIRRADNGECRHLNAAETMLTGLDAKPEWVIGTNLDVTERHAAVTRLEASLREVSHLRAALDEHSIVAITDPKGKITSVNDKFCAISQYTREELLGQDHRIINSGYHGKDFMRNLWGTITLGQVWKGEIKNRAKDGSHYWVSTTIVPFLDSGGRPVQFVAIRTDITQRKWDEERLAELARSLAEKNKELEAIVYVASHDLRSPLVNIQGFGKELRVGCETLRQKFESLPLPEAEKQALQRVLEEDLVESLGFIHAGVVKIDSLLTGLLRFSRLGRVALSVEVIDMNEMLKGIVQAMEFQLKQAGAELVVEALPPCMADAGQVSQVFSNLLDNAIKYLDPSRAGRITVSGQVKDNQVVYQVSDNGMGIAPEHQPKVFEIFHRLNPRHSSGEGLGLTIAQRALERQGGSIWVDSMPGRGSAFFVALPAAEGVVTPTP